jgi:hypothetical protein
MIIVALYFIAELIINPDGEFSLNDDWAYALSVKEYVSTGKLHFSFWQAIPGLSQFMAGIVAAKILGFSFTLLRLISVACVPIMIFMLELILWRLQINGLKKMAVLFAFVFNPLTLVLSNTWLPDILQLFLSLSAFTVFILFNQGKKNIFFLLFILLCALATLNRQTGLIIPLCTGIAYLLLNKKRSRNDVMFAVIPFCICLVALMFFEHIASSAGRLSPNYGLQLHNIFESFTHPAEAVKKSGYYFVTSSVCIGLFVLPFFLASLKLHLKDLFSTKPISILFLFYLLLIGLKIYLMGKVFPFTGNIFYNRGIGPLIMTGFNTDEAIHVSFFERIIWIFLNFAGGLSFFCVSRVLLVQARKENNVLRKLSISFFLLLCVFYLFPLCLSYVNDRYLLLLLPFLLINLSFAEFQVNWKICLSTLLIYTFISVVATHDYMAFNRARYKAIDELMEKESVSAEQIDGGFEFNAWYFSEKRPYNPSHKGRWWWVQDEKYIISPAKLPEYSLHNDYTYASWLAFSKKRIYVYEK